MAVIKVKKGEAAVRDDGVEILRLEYDLPPDARPPLSPAEIANPAIYGGHVHEIPLTAVWSWMQRYGITAAEAVEECVLQVVDAARFASNWPPTDAQRRAARGRHDASDARRYGDKVRNPKPGEMAAVRNTGT